MPGYLLGIPELNISIHKPDDQGRWLAEIFDLERSSVRPLGVGVDQDPYKALGIALNKSIETWTGYLTVITKTLEK